MVNHQRQLHALQSTDQLLELSACSFCFFQDAATDLACSHRLCIQCTTYWGSKTEPSYWYVKFCPVCKHQSDTTSNLGLSVAGCRVLRLGGTDPAEIWNFLRQLQRIIGLTSMPFRDQFDKVVATDIGLYDAHPSPKLTYGSIYRHFLRNHDISRGLGSLRLQASSAITKEWFPVCEVAKKKLVKSLSACSGPSKAAALRSYSLFWPEAELGRRKAYALL
jgi:hypothetical protein